MCQGSIVLAIVNFLFNSVVSRLWRTAPRKGNFQYQYEDG